MRRKVLGVLGLALIGALAASSCLFDEEEQKPVCRSTHPRFVPDRSTPGDVTPPSATTVVRTSISTKDEEAEASCTTGDSPNYCAGVVLAVRFQATDDMTPADRLGVMVRFISGTKPDYISLGPMPIGGGVGLFTYALPAKAYSMELEVQAIDLNENLGPPTRFTITQPAIEPSPTPLASMQWLGLVALAGGFAGRRRRRR